MSFLIPWGRQDNYNWEDDQRLPGEPKRVIGPNCAPVVLCQPLGTGVRLTFRNMFALSERKFTKKGVNSMPKSVFRSLVVQA